MQTYIVYLSFFDMVFAFSHWTVFSVSHSTTNIWFLGNNKWTTERDHIDLQSFKDIVRSITKLLKP